MKSLLKISDILEIKPSDICSISDKCGNGFEDKYNDLVEYMKKNGIKVPKEYL
ncbi:hypothetical protein OVA29_21850 [Exiguobacterium sp. SL14]|nr:hypothetical protein [Exiguobacterium sp. SL14]